VYNLVTIRIRKVLYSILIILLLLCVRLVFVQLGAAKSLTNIASGQYKIAIPILPKRGIIYDRNLKELAVSINLASIFLEPWRIKDKEAAAFSLSEILHIDRKDVLRKLNQKRGFVWLARKVQPEIERSVRELNLKGVCFIREPQRLYPNLNLASHIIGFTGLDNEGLEGVELKFDKFLKGVLGWRYAIRDAKQREVMGYEYREIPSIDGDDIVLTIDNVIQAFAEKHLEEDYKKYNAKGACIIVMNPYTGEILAFANRPTYDPNNVKQFSVDARRNRIVCDFFEPGSSFKIVAASALLEEKKVKPTEKFFCENGEYKWAGHTYHDHKPHGWLTFADVIRLSSNIGTMKAANRLGQDKFYSYIKKFGFGEKTGVDLIGETAGITAPPYKWSKLSLCSMSMGQEITVTAIQLACAVSTIANGGMLIKPKIVDRIQDKHGDLIQKFESKNIHRVISEETSSQVRDILRGVVEDGTAQSAEVEDYFPAGKTGTAQKIEPNGTYSHSKFMASFIGFLPYDNPKFVIVVTMDEPHPFYYGGVVCTPIFKDVGAELMSYYKIEPNGTDKIKNIFSRK
jgi:cell division protein FtsI (penicillin-binding protein 3)